jgi:hypothetical protein
MSFIATFKKSLQTLNQQDFTALALDLFRFQATNNATYHLYIKYLGINPAKITKLTEIPFMPIEFFKTHKILTHETSQYSQINYSTPTMVFESSKTTGQIASCHHVLDTDFYLQNAERIFNSFYGDLSDYHLLALLPSYLERQTSSLVYMVQGFMNKTSSFSGFYLDNFEELAIKLQQLQATKQKILLIGVTFALLDFAEQFPIKLPHAIIMETGGMKGRRAELLREEVHQILTSAFACDAIHSEYGMTELLSQGYSKGQGIFELPPTMRVFIRNITDPFEINGNFRDGGINIIDLANVESCAFIETKDIGCFANDEKTTFKVLGRYDNSEVRGCNLLVF